MNIKLVVLFLTVIGSRSDAMHHNASERRMAALDAMEQRQGLEMLSLPAQITIKEKPKPIISDEILPAPERSQKNQCCACFLRLFR